MKAKRSDKFIQLMRNHYLASPGRFPVAYYRMRAIAHRYELVTSGNNIFYKGNRVWSFVYRGELITDQLAEVDSLILPEVEALDNLPGFRLTGSVYRLFHRTLTLNRPDVENIEVVQARPEQETSEIANVLNRCYGVQTFIPQTIIEWTRGDAYCPSLWLWAIDTRNGTKAGIFITDLDPEIKEACFDWIQLLPEYRGKRIGEVLISETLARLRSVADIAYVGTPYEESARFYRKCGFAGQKLLEYERIGTKLLSYDEARAT